METNSQAQPQQPQIPLPPGPPEPSNPPPAHAPPGRPKANPQQTQGGKRGGGRGSKSGRVLYNVGGRGSGGRGGRGSGSSGGEQQQQAQKVSFTSGIPFGHVPAYLPGSSSLVEELDQRIMIVLRDGRHLVGNLRTFDQYSNLVLGNASERRFHSPEEVSEAGKKVTYFTDVPLGMYIVRGDSIVLLGQVEEEDETEEATVTMKRVENDEFDELLEAAAAEEEEEPDADEAKDGKSLEWDFDKDLLA